ncbi:MAG: GDSL-type esterase/lipase family protein [Cyanobacteria bacterium J06592_8]
MRSHKVFIFLTVLTGILLASSVAFNLILFNQAKKYYLELNQTRLDPLGWNKYPADLNPKRKESSTVRVVFFGDSRAAEWQSPTLEGYEFINRGIGSQTTIQTLQRFEQHITPLQPDIIIIQVGVNDLKTIPLFPKAKDAIIADSKENIQRIVERSKAKDAIVILTPIFPIGSIPLERQPFWSEDVDLAVDEVNTYLQSLASQTVIVFETSSLLADQKGKLKPEYSKDELHLTPEGYRVLNQELVPVLNSLEAITVKR